MEQRRRLALLAAVLAALLLLGSTLGAVKALADGDEDEEEYGEGYEEEEEEYEGRLTALGEAAFYGGVALNLGFVGLRMLRGLVDVPPRLQRLALEVHMDGNIALGAAGLMHGAANLGEAGPIEYGMAVLIVFLMASGMLMRYWRGRRAKLVARMVHTQRFLALLLLVLAVAHVEAMD
ncbi:MAG: hypothetical protein GXO15_05910 [Crenarchaeota archaeon]|nr:hypothetical protein [Thermoproteota archaeon]